MCTYFNIVHQYSVGLSLSHTMLKFLLLIAVFSLANAKIIIEKAQELFDAAPTNNYPMIGILSQEIPSYSDENHPEKFQSYIAASYVKFVEGGGARAVPVW